MKKPTEIKTELDSTTKRLDELTEMRDGINNNLQTLQSGFVDGKASLDNLQTEQSKLAALDSSIKILEAKQEESHSEFQKASLAEKRKELLGKAKVIATDAETFLNEYFEMRGEFESLISDSAEKLIDKVLAFRNKQKEYAATIREIEPKITKQPTMESRQAEISLDKELEQLGLEGKTLNLATTDYINYPPAKFGECIAIAERLVAEEIYRKGQAEQRAAFEAERAETQAAQKAKRDEEKAILSREFEAERQRVVQFRIDNGLPALLPESLDNAVREVQTRTADAVARGAKVSG